MYGFRGFDCRNNLHYINEGADMIYHAAGAGIILNISSGELNNAYLPSHYIIMTHFYHFYCTEICDKLSSDLAMLTYIYLNVDDCRLTSSMPQQRFKHQTWLNYAVIPENVISKD